MSEPLGPRHSAAQHLIAAEDLLDAAGSPAPHVFQTDQEAHMAWSARAQSCAFLAAAHIALGIILATGDEEADGNGL